jgi:hypothetical protein
MTSLLGKRKTPEPGRASHNEDLTVTPTGSPARKKLKITQSQKQAIIDNLQLESKIVLPTTTMEAMVPLDSVLLTQAVTERARKLRAQYALQAQDLRARIERRVNRIPLALRKATMGELLEKYGATTRSDEATQTFKKPALPPKTAKHAPITTISRDVEGSSVSAAAPTPVKGQARRPKRATYGLSFFLLYEHADRSLVMMVCFRTRRMPRSPLMSIFLSIIRRNAVTQTLPVNRVLSLRSSAGLRRRFSLRSLLTHEPINNHRLLLRRVNHSNKGHTFRDQRLP